ncbi:MAG: hypothetical protein LBJ67_17000 [Planctomycetaceae bacterium]|jgi:hypothetical protein|nr:hypothetical protein [Planctomycetaceae bacterium]
MIKRNLITCLLFIVLFLENALALTADDIYFPKQEEPFYSLPTTWAPIAEENKIRTMQMLVAPIEGSFQKIHSASGEFYVEYTAGVNANLAKLVQVPEKMISENLFRKINFTLAFESDLRKKNLFRSLQVDYDKMVMDDQSHTLKNIASLNSSSIVTSKELIFSEDANRFSTLPELPDFPEMENKRVAWREPPEIVNNRQLFEYIDPCECYDLKLWGSVGYLLRVLKGEFSKKEQKIVIENVHLFESVDDKGARWFRLTQKIQPSANDENGKRELNIFWYEDVGFHPVCSLYLTSAHELINLIQVRWEKVDEVYFPTESLFMVCDASTGKLSFRRKITRKKIAVNQSIDPQKFTYSALGLNDGDLLVDRIKQTVYTIQNNKPVKLAKFYEKYQTPYERSVNTFRFIIIGIGILLMATGIVLKFLRHKKRVN